MLPTANMRPFGNTMLINFNFVPKDSRPDHQRSADEVSGEILRQSFLNITGLAHRARMPNLELFANAGFPFTRKADLGETVVIMPDSPTTAEITLLLDLMSHCGTQTGYPVLRVEISDSGAVMRRDRDYLILGGTSDQPALGALSSYLPVTLSEDGVKMSTKPGFLATVAAIRDQLLAGKWRLTTPQQLSNEDGIPDLLIEGIESPFFPGRSIVTIAIHSDSAVDEFASVFSERSQSSDIAHSVSLMRHGKFTSYNVPTAQYHVGSIAPYPLMRLWLAENFWVLYGAVILLSLLLAIYARDYLSLLAAARLRER